MNDIAKKNVICIQNKSGCLGDLILVEVQSDMKFQYDTKSCSLTIGTAADNYWFGHCSIYDRKTSFILSDISKIQEFKIIQVGFDDYMQIKVNEHVVYVGPDGGDRLAFTNQGLRVLVDNGLSKANCERGMNWNQDLNIDLKPYLVEGDNNLDMRVIVSGEGEGWLKILATRSYCEEYIVQLSGNDSFQSE